MKDLSHSFAIVFKITLACHSSTVSAQTPLAPTHPSAGILVTADLKDDEAIRVLPVYAKKSAASGPAFARLQAWVYEPETSSFKRNLAIEALAAGIGFDSVENRAGLFRERARDFIVDNERGKTVQIWQHAKVIGSGETGTNCQVLIPVCFEPPPWS